MASFSNRLKQLRIERGLTQQQLADILNISKSSINMYERGEREPGFETLEAIADVFNVDMNFLLGKSHVKNQLLEDTPLSKTDELIKDDPLAGQLFAAYGKVKEEFSQAEIDDITMIMEMIAEKKRRKREKGEE